MAEIKFELNRLINYSDEEIIREMQRVAKLINTEWITKKEFNKHSKVYAGTIEKRFGWKNALERAGLADRWSGGDASGRRDSRKYTNRKYTNEDMVTELRRVATVLDGQFVTESKFNCHSQMSPNSIRSRFDSWSKALRYAGLEISNLGKRYTESECWENLLSVWTHYGRQPTYGEMHRPPSMIQAQVYKKRWGTWTKALLAFIEYANSDSKLSITADPNDQPTRDEKIDVPSQESFPSKQEVRVNKKISPEDRREISLGLRYKVLHRDHFKCVLCGNNPPASPGLILHIDHITPYSKGGKTVIDNLRTLCEPCNLGRGNRYTD